MLRSSWFLIETVMVNVAAGAGITGAGITGAGGMGAGVPGGGATGFGVIGFGVIGFGLGVGLLGPCDGTARAVVRGTAGDDSARFPVAGAVAL
jgi:hypothetical protein